MADTSSNIKWENSQNCQGFEQREYRFTDEMRPLFYKWLGISEGSNVLDAGCGTGVFSRYLARGLKQGHVTGFDISGYFIEYGQARLKELNLSDKVTLEQADGFNLHYSDNTFDAVTNYTYIGVLSDPMAGMKEMIRVCKTGGVVSCVVATMGIPNVWWPGDYPFDGGNELKRLILLESSIYHNFVSNSVARDLNQNVVRDGNEEGWNGLRYPKMFDVCGLEEIRLHPFAYTLGYNDSSLPEEYRKNLLCEETESEIGYIKWRYNDKKDIYNAHGFADGDMERLIELLNKKLDYVRANFENDRSFEWRGGFNFIVAGKKKG